MMLSALNTRIFGKAEKLKYYETIGSTNDEALGLARAGAEEGHVVWSAFQEKGKGRLGRTWQAPPGKNLSLSILCRPQMALIDSLKMTLGSAWILRQSIISAFPEYAGALQGLKLKWPNDLVYERRKVAGILVESISRERNTEALVCGFGLNVNWSRSEMPDELAGKATSLKDICGTALEIKTIAAKLIENFETRYLQWQQDNFESVNELWLSVCDHKDRELSFKTAQGVERGRFCGIDARGFLIYETANGDKKTLISGEIEDYY